ncbi:MAG: uL30 family ribosomal protein [Candidatus Aenigmatarchaeota archaeon]
MIAVIRIRGPVKTPHDVKRTLELLRLKRVNHCVLLNEKPEIIGMLKKVSDYITWGEIDKNMLNKLLERKGVKEPKGIFRLKPPTKGFKSTRLPWPKGDLGYRGEAINKLLERMI